MYLLVELHNKSSGIRSQLIKITSVRTSKAKTIQKKVGDNQNPPGDARTGCSNPKRARRGVMSAGALRRHLNLASPSSESIAVSWLAVELNSEDSLRFLNVKSMLEAFWSRELEELKLDSVSWAGVNEGDRGMIKVCAQGSNDKEGGSGLEGVYFFGWSSGWKIVTWVRKGVRKGILNLPIPTDGLGEFSVVRASHVILTSSNLDGREKRAEIWSREGKPRADLVEERLSNGLDLDRSSSKSTCSTHVWGTSSVWLPLHESKREREDSSPGEERE